MKVGGTKGTNSTSKTKGTSSPSGDSSVDFSQYVRGGGVSESSAASAARSIAQLDALLAVQEIEDPTKKAAKKRVISRGDDILDKMEDLRVKILNGNLSIGHMIDIADVVASHRDKIDDPRLTAIMDEIDLRAQVELAKMRIALDKL